VQDYEPFEFMVLFCAAMQGGKDEGEYAGDFVRADENAFAEVIDELRERDNAVALRIRTFPSATRRTCPAFPQGLSAARTASILERQGPSCELFRPTLGREELRKALASPDFEAVREIFREYANAVGYI
jgi:hypothetical protein